MANYSLKFSITSFGGVIYGDVTGFEQVTTLGSTKYYIIDYYSYSASMFDETWIFQSRASVYYNSCTLEYIGSYFYISSNSYIYKTDISFN